MRLSVVSFLLVTLVAIGAGVAIAGLPSDPPDDLVIDAPPATTTTTTTVAPTSSTVPPTTTTLAAEPDVTTTTESPTTTTITTTTTTVPGAELVDRAELDVGVANAAGVTGVAGNTADQLRELGYETLQPVDTEAPLAVSLVFFQPGLELEAARLAADLGWGEEATAPYDDLPPLMTDRVFELVALVGTDRA